MVKFAPNTQSRKKVTVILLLASVAITAYCLTSLYSSTDFSTSERLAAALHPATEKPDNIVLVPTFDMPTSLSVRWRTSKSIDDGVVQFAESRDPSPGETREIRATATVLTSREMMKQDGTVRCYSATLTDLLPDTSYSYRVGSRKRDIWSEYHTFTTAPKASKPFSFIYIGDAQYKPENVGAMLKAVEDRHPETKFYMLGGDLVDRGNSRNLWDKLLANTTRVFSRKPVAPAMGNHDYMGQNAGVAIYNAYFNPSANEGDRKDVVSNYSFRHGDAYFIVVNSLDIAAQTEWLEKELQTADAVGASFKIVMNHYPVYNPLDGRSNLEAQTHWVPLFDQYEVDLVLTGHDHSYMRSKPLRAGIPVETGDFGSIYVVATGCEKFYKFRELDIAEIQFTDTATYQLITIGGEGDKRRQLRYTAYAFSGEIMDEFVMIKQ